MNKIKYKVRFFKNIGDTTTIYIGFTKCLATELLALPLSEAGKTRRCNSEFEVVRIGVVLGGDEEGGGGTLAGEREVIVREQGHRGILH